jgi:hypothetical protein
LRLLAATIRTTRFCTEDTPNPITRATLRRARGPDRG